MGPETSRDTIITELYNSPEITAAIGKMEPAHLRDELKQEMFVVLCDMEAEKLIDLYSKKQIKFYLVRVMLNMMCSDRSTFFNTHRRYAEKMLSGIVTLSTEGNFEITHASLRLRADHDDVEGAWQTPKDLIHHDEPETNRLIEIVNDAVEELDEYEAGLIKLYAEMGNSCKPVAHATKISERGVRFAVSRARIKLQKKLRA